MLHRLALSSTFLLLAGALPARPATVRGTLRAAGLTAIAMDATGRAASAPGPRFSLAVPGSSGRVLLLDADTSVRGPVVLAVAAGGRVLPVARARARGACAADDARAVLRFTARGRKPVQLGPLAVDAHMAYPRRRLPRTRLDTTHGLAAVDASCTPVGAGKLGMATTPAALVAADATPDEPATAGEADPDGDGMPNAVDADDDGDGILDNDDRDSGNGPPPAADGARRFWVFSNFHQDLERSLNANAMPVDEALIDAALVRAAGLAFQVVGNGTVGDVELDCGTLPYCSAGGTGRTREPYPDGIEFPEGADPDGNALGTIVAGPSGDFQLAPFGDAPAGHPASTLLRAGDVYRERYRDADGTVVEVPGMLNFMFHTTPAVARAVTGIRAYDVSYPVVAGAAGTRDNPFHVPTTGPGTVTLTVWRPQRRGVPDAGEAALVDMGNLRLVTNLPSGPCTAGTGPGNPPQCDPGPGLCPPDVYTEDDANLTVVGDGLQDALGDRPADPANTFTYTIDLAACLARVAGVTWDAGESVMVPVQMMNVYGDNAAQNVFFVRDDS
jgi:hypothetical protein